MVFTVTIVKSPYLAFVLILENHIIELRGLKQVDSASTKSSSSTMVYVEGILQFAPVTNALST